jgi:heme/copper-type cytochrome/quinol oxidase subunit 3
VTEVRLPSEPQTASGFRGRPSEWWAMLMLIVTELTLFAVLLASYYYLRFQSQPEWPPADIKEPSLSLPLAMTLVLLTSSLPMWLAEQGIRRGSQRQLRLGLSLSLFLGAVFLGAQAYEYSEKLKEFTPQDNAYGSLFFTISGLHGAHVAFGLLLISWTLARALRGRYAPERHIAVQTTALYWHFVDGAWLAIMFTLYVSPHLG